VHQSQPLLEPDHHVYAVFGIAVRVLVQVNASHPQTCYWLEVGLGAELGKRVDGEGVVAQDAGLVDLGEDEDLLYAGPGVIVVRRL
jgi:hypothetical protein